MEQKHVVRLQWCAPTTHARSFVRPNTNENNSQADSQAKQRESNGKERKESQAPFGVKRSPSMCFMRR